MLVITRAIGQQIVIDSNIVLTVVAIEGNKIRLGIAAPKSVTVDRAEVHQRRLAERHEGQWSEPACGAVLVGS